MGHTDFAHAIEWRLGRTTISIMPPHVILASASPARHTLLLRSGITPEIIVSGIDEESPELLALGPKELAYELALRKASAIDPGRGDGFIIGCDSVFELDGVAYGKPGTPEMAKERLQQMSGRTGTLHTGHALINIATGQVERALTSTDVTIVNMSEVEMDAYIATGEPLQVAGSFTIDSLGGPLVASIHGDPSNVEGLSLPTLRELFARHGLGWEIFLTQ